jgi:hypothetical protein
LALPAGRSTSELLSAGDTFSTPARAGREGDRTEGDPPGSASSRWSWAWGPETSSWGDPGPSTRSRSFSVEGAILAKARADRTKMGCPRRCLGRKIEVTLPLAVAAAAAGRHPT